MTSKQYEAGDYKFFAKEAEKVDGVRIQSAASMEDPDPNLSGSICLDHALVIPFPAGRITEVYGPNGSCKTTLVLEVAGQALLAGKQVLYVNMERNLNRSLVETVRSIRPFIEDQDKDDCPLRIAEAPHGEAAFELMRKFASQFPGSVVILDSIDASQPEAVLSGEIGELKVGSLARLMSDATRKLITALSENNVTCIMVNQQRNKITSYGDPRTTPGGEAVLYYASQRIELMKPGKAQELYREKDQVGVVIRFKVKKNKCAPDGIEGEFPILYGHGIWREKELVQKGLEFGVLQFGGRGGKQVLMPRLNRETMELVVDEDDKPVTMPMKQAKAWQRLLIDTALCGWLEERVRDLIEPTHFDAVKLMFEEEESEV